MCVFCRNLDVVTEVSDGFGSCVGQMVVDPAEQQLLRGEGHQVVQFFSLGQKADQTWIHRPVSSQEVRSESDKLRGFKKN